MNSSRISGNSIELWASRPVFKAVTLHVYDMAAAGSIEGPGSEVRNGASKGLQFDDDQPLDQSDGYPMLDPNP